jgi:hypothetical protein
MAGMKQHRIKRWLPVVILLAFWTAPAFGQACAMCYANARATPKEAQRAINRAILVLLIPPIGIMTAGAGMAFRYSKRRDLENEDSNSSH